MKITLAIVVVLIAGCNQKASKTTPMPVDLPSGAEIVSQHGRTWYTIKIKGQCFLLRDYGNVSYKSKMKCNN